MMSVGGLHKDSAFLSVERLSVHLLGKKMPLLSGNCVYLVEAGGIEPPSASPLPSALHAYPGLLI